MDKELESKEEVVRTGSVAEDVADFLGDTTPDNFEELDDGFPAEEPFGHVEDEDEPIVEKEEGVAKTDVEEEKEEVDPSLEQEKEEDVEVITDPLDKEEVVDPAFADLKAQNDLLLAKIEELSNPEAKPVEGEKPEAPAQSTTLEQAEVYDFVGDADLDTILSSKEDFNAFLSKIVNSTMNTTVENVYRNLPSVVSSQVKQQTSLKTFVDEFYAENKDLLSVRKTVAAVANEVAAEHPDYSLEQVFEETETKTRTMLGLKKAALDSKKGEEAFVSPTGKKPALPSKGGGRKGVAGKPLTLQQKHISDVLD